MDEKKKEDSQEKLSLFIKSVTESSYSAIMGKLEERFKVYDDSINRLKTQTATIIKDKDDELKASKIREKTYKNISLLVGIIFTIIQILKAIGT